MNSHAGALAQSTTTGRVNQRWLIYKSDGFHNDILLQSPNHGLVQLPKGIYHVTNLYQRRVRFDRCDNAQLRNQGLVHPDVAEERERCPLTTFQNCLVM